MRWSSSAWPLMMIVASCSWSVGVIPIDEPDTYIVIRSVPPLQGDQGEAIPLARTEAEEFCQKKNGNFIFVKDEWRRPLWYSASSYSVWFRCVPPDGSANSQPTP
jgi:hypothetical protein